MPHSYRSVAPDSRESNASAASLADEWHEPSSAVDLSSLLAADPLTPEPGLDGRRSLSPATDALETPRTPDLSRRRSMAVAERGRANSAPLPSPRARRRAGDGGQATAKRWPAAMRRLRQVVEERKPGASVERARRLARTAASELQRPRQAVGKARTAAVEHALTSTLDQQSTISRGIPS